MARKNTLLVALTSFVVILLLIPLVRYLFPRSIMGFADMSCYGVACQEGEFCQSGSCKKIYPQETNNYFNEGFQDSCPPGTKKNENGDCHAVEGFADPLSGGTIAGIVLVTLFLVGGATYYMYTNTTSALPPLPIRGGRR